MLHKVKVNILNTEYKAYVIWGKPKEAKDYINSYFESDFELSEFSDCRGKCFYRKGFHPTVWVNDKDRFWATLAHEAIHAINYIWEFVREENRDEVFAHSVGAIVWAVENYKRKKKGVKKNVFQTKER